MTHRNKYILSICFLTFLILLGCSQHIRPATKMHIRTERNFVKNYEIGRLYTAIYGQPVVKVDEIIVDRYKVKYMRGTDDFVISSGVSKMITRDITGDKDTDYKVRGEITLKGDSYTVLDVPQEGRLISLLIKKDGTVHNKVLNDDIIVVYKYTITPSNLKFIPLLKEKEKTSSGRISYEYTYMGYSAGILMFGRPFPERHGNYIHFVNKPVVFVDGFVPPDKVHLGDAVIEVYEASDKKIVYRVISDRLN